MNIQKVFIIIGLLTTFPSFLYSRNNDSIPGQFSDSVSLDRKYCDKTVKILGVAVPAVMITYGIASLENGGIGELDHSIRRELLKNNYIWNNGWDNYLQFSPAVAAFGMKLYGVKSTHKMPDMIALYTLSNVLEIGIVYTTKFAVSKKRPDGSDNHSFPSGHTAMAFVAAEFLHQEYKDQSVWISVGGYAMGTLIGISRVFNDRHWVSDVIAGAGIGILSTKVVYWTYPYLQKAFGKKDRKLNAVVFPSYNGGVLGLNVSCGF
ncbi:MAG: phosphatase PAP2 family protein [Dysgonamonadaceae bacterium]|jgi:membrane-associated phospholipid phosphatase|nr:phosphatase PAP2 family protein [Dysgonamonadaceae bacterium]